MNSLRFDQHSNNYFVWPIHLDSRPTRISFKRYAICAATLSVLLNSACTAIDRNRAPLSEMRVQSVYTDLGHEACDERVDLDDPNESTYQLCAGVSDYYLIVRLVGSGRKSIDIRTPKETTFPLDYQEFVTRHMAELGSRAEWRVTLENGKKVPIALIVPVEAHEDEDEPEQVTSIYLAVAKITPTEICVTDRIVKDSVSRARVHDLADSASSKACLEARPHMVID